MNKSPNLIGPSRRDAEMAQGFGCADKHFSLIIRTDDGSTMLKTRVEHMHEAFQTLIDWSIDEVDQDVLAVISGPNGFSTSHRLKASKDFAWIEET